MGTDAVRFGIKTTPMHTTYDDILATWKAADAEPVFDDAWLWDHMLPLVGDPAGPVYEGWTLLAALAAQTTRLRLGHLVTALPVRPPAVLGKMAATLDVISGGRLVLGIGAGATDDPSRHVDGIPDGQAAVVREYQAYGLPLVRPAEGIARLDEAITLIKRLWTDDLFDFAGEHYQLTGARCAPKPVQQPHPPILVGGWGPRMLRVVARHADAWNVPGPPWNTVEDIQARSQILDQHCADLGRDPATIERSVQVMVRRDTVDETRDALARLVDVGVTHLVLAPVPHTADAVRWLADDVVSPLRDELPVG